MQWPECIRLLRADTCPHRKTPGMPTFSYRRGDRQRHDVPRTTAPLRAVRSKSRSTSSLLDLQRTIGNRAVGRMLQAMRPAHGDHSRISKLPDVTGRVAVLLSGTGASAMRRQPKEEPPPTKPTFYKEHQGVTDRIEDAYRAGSLAESAWKALVADAERATAAGQVAIARRAYLALYADA